MSARGAIQLAAVIRKEVNQTVRDRRIMFLLIVAPLIQTILFGYAVDFDVDRVPTVVADADRSDTSRLHARRLLADGTLTFAGEVRTAAEADRQIDDGTAVAALIVPAGFGEDLTAGRQTEVQVVLDGADPNRAIVTAYAASGYFGQVTMDLVREKLAAAGRPEPPVISAPPRVLYNPSLRTAMFMLPGVMSMLLVIVTTIVTAMALSREHEVGTLEQVLVTPIRPLVLLVGKMTPNIVIGLGDVALVLTAAMWLFHVPVRGSLWVLFVGSVLYLFSTLGVGLLISTLSNTQQQSFLGGFLFALPAMLLSGAVTPIRAMPGWLQAVTWLNPLRYYATLTRANLLKGAGFADLWVEFAALTLFGLAIMTLATLRFQRRTA